MTDASIMRIIQILTNRDDLGDTDRLCTPIDSIVDKYKGMVQSAYAEECVQSEQRDSMS